MKGLELSEKFYFEYGEPMLKESFPSLLELIAVGLVGSGSECFGFDDGISQDHDFEPGFCIFLPDEDIIDRKTAFAIERAYSKLPKEFMGYERSSLSAVGGNRHGVIRTGEFFVSKTGTPDGKLSMREWLLVPEQSLAEATNGRLFCDGLGVVTDIRARLEYLPENVRLKKLAGNLLLMGQSGQYNYARCISRSETAAAQLAMHEFVLATLKVIFLLNRRYILYYKWSFRALRELPLLSSLHDTLEYLISSSNTPDEAKIKQDTVEQICAAVINELKVQNLTDIDMCDIEKHAYAVNNRISDGDIRNLHILYAV